jgi:anti-sigma factor RsiW
VLNCRQFLDELCDYLDGTADSQTFLDTERHLAMCRKCRIVCETTRQTVALYRRMWSVYGLPSGVERRLMAALEKHIGR